MSESNALLGVQGLHVTFEDRSRGWLARGRKVQAVRGVDLAIESGKCVGLVGESGCGKSTLARAILGLLPVDAGQIYFDGHDLMQANSADMRGLRPRMQMIFQQSSASMNPRMTVESIVSDPLRFVGGCRGDERTRRVGDILAQVGLDDRLRTRFPHELSGGQLQRVAIARALVLNPEFLICDEPVSALDVTAQIEILDHLKGIQQQRGLTMLLITHDLDIASTMCDELAVMYLGRIVERGPIARVIRNPQHPYTFFLNEARTQFNRDAEQPARMLAARMLAARMLAGEPPSPVDPPLGCAFHPQCPLASDVCRSETPRLEAVSPGAPDQDAACHHTHRIVELAELTSSVVN